MINKVDGKNVCISLTLENIFAECTSDCSYKTSTGTSVTLANSCVSHYSMEGKKYCKLGSGNPQFKDYITAKKNWLKDNSSQYACHTVYKNKGDPLDVCDTSTASKTLSDYKLARSKVILRKSDFCLKNLIFGEQILQSKQCPQLRCGNSTVLGMCAYSQSYTEINEKNAFELSIFPNQCTKEQTCSFNLNAAIEKGLDIKAHCQDKYLLPINLRLPGEECSKDIECFNTECHKGRCASKVNSTEQCDSHTDCEAGKSCIYNSCTKQKSFGDSCSSSYDCKNNLICMDGTCSKLFSLDVASFFTIQENKFANLLCDSNWAEYSVNTEKVGYKCNRLESYSGSVRDGNCTLGGDKCQYMDSRGSIVSRDCECGYNINGTGQCPLIYSECNILK
jgi:hypothetical protein